MKRILYFFLTFIVVTPVFSDQTICECRKYLNPPSITCVIDRMLPCVSSNEIGEFESTVNELIHEGWKLVSIESGGFGVDYFVFEKKMQSR